MFKQRFLISHVYLGHYKYLSWHLLHTCEVKKTTRYSCRKLIRFIFPIKVYGGGLSCVHIAAVHWVLVRVACVTSITAHVYSFCVSRKSPTAIYG